MKPVSNNFKNELLEFGRQYENVIGIYDYVLLATEDDNFLTTEDDKDIIARVSNTDFETELNDEDIYSIKIITKGEILSTLMKELDFETTEDIQIGRVINYKFGLKIPNDDTEFIDYGNFIVYKKEYDEATERYTYTCYDFMLRTMRVIGSEFRITTPTINGEDLIKKICEVLSLDFDDAEEDENHKPTPFGMIGHKDIAINIETLNQYKLTYRDLLGLLCQYFGVSMYMENNELKLKLLGNIEYNEDTQEWFVNNDEPLIVDTLTADYLKDNSVSFKNKYGKINALEITGTNESNQQYVQDAESVTNNGLTLFSINKNILFNDSAVWEQYGYDITQDIFKLLNGIEYQLNEISTNGVLFLDWLDFYNIEVKGTTYKCLLLNSEITISSGIQESIYTDIPEETIEEYTSNPSTREDIIADSVRARGNVYATNVEASNRIDANIINANAVGEDLENVIRQISPGGGSDEIAISETEPTEEGIKLWIDTGVIGSQASEITNSYSTSTGKGYSANYINNLVVDSISSKNMFDKNNVLKNKRIASDGAPYTENGYFLSDYIPIKSNTTYTISRANQPTSSMNCYALYDSSKNFISRSSFYGTLTITFTSSSNAKYIRITDTNDNLNSLQIEKGEDATTYSNYQDFDNFKYERMAPENFITLNSGYSFGETSVYRHKNHYTGTISIKKNSKFGGDNVQEQIGVINTSLGTLSYPINTYGVSGATNNDIWAIPVNFAYIYIVNAQNQILLKGKNTDSYVKFNIDIVLS